MSNLRNLPIWNYMILVVAAVFITAGTILMISGDILGDRTTGIATICGILGIGLIPTWKKRRDAEG